MPKKPFVIDGITYIPPKQSSHLPLFSLKEDVECGYYVDCDADHNGPQPHIISKPWTKYCEALWLEAGELLSIK